MDHSSNDIILTGGSFTRSIDVDKENEKVPSKKHDDRISTSAYCSKTTVDFKIICNKQKHDVNFPLDGTILTLKQHIQSLTGLPSGMQKVMYKGLARDEKSLREEGVTDGAKVMVVGSTISDVLSVNTPNIQHTEERTPVLECEVEPLSRHKMHRKVLEKGLPDDALPGLINEKAYLPTYPLSGMLNKTGDKVRITFKMELDQMWISTKDRTDKVRMGSIKNVISEPIDGYDAYHLLAFQLGPSQASRYWLYWVPSQYVEAIKDAVQGHWQFS
jgi:hypothetical protein